MRHGSCDMSQRRLIDWRASYVVERESGVNVVYIIQQVEEFQVVILSYANAMISETEDKYNPKTTSWRNGSI